MCFFKLLIGLLATCAVVSAQNNTTICDTNSVSALLSCYNTYLNGYNMSLISNALPDYWDFHTIRMNWLEQNGIHVQPNICIMFRNLQKCVQPYSCLNGAGAYTQMGAYNSTEAFDWWLDFVVSQFQCNAGYNALMQEFYCISFCADYHEAALDACSDQMNQQIANGTDVCVATQGFLDCHRNIITGCCDNLAGAYDCNLQVAALNATVNTCINMGKLTCPSMAVKLPNKQPNFDAITKIRENLALRAEHIHS
ncbi:hypothetical protein WR25_18531 [Diploscapter pachys]|uniref:DUF19 domain-containing protein n=1 Tax=Diploscapter pachys TaxID=2018661 RepID=A0A2A2LGG9_9BILA|nr:hypothetical protein WR25_18531 [Diploscapter pachys]